MFGTGAGN